MRVILKDRLIALAPTDAAEAESLRALVASADGHVFHLRAQGTDAVVLHDAGPRAVACCEPINIHSGVKDEALKLIGNLAHTPFDLDGKHYAMCIRRELQRPR